MIAKNFEIIEKMLNKNNSRSWKITKNDSRVGGYTLTLQGIVIMQRASLKELKIVLIAIKGNGNLWHEETTKLNFQTMGGKW